MIVYKITNTKNGKIYIGQTTRTLEERFQRHKQDALSGRLDTHFARAIRKYGPEAFIAEIIDTATTQEELTNKEYYWIGYYKTYQKGYNETFDKLKSGGNTYRSKTKEEMKQISSKIRDSKLGGKNPAARAVKCKNMITGEELFFASCSECQQFFQETNHNFITRRCCGKTKCLYKKQWAIAYQEDKYRDFSIEKGSTRAQPIQVVDTETKEAKIFPSYASAERYYKVPLHSFVSNAYKQEKTFVVLHYQITKIN